MSEAFFLHTATERQTLLDCEVLSRNKIVKDGQLQRLPNGLIRIPATTDDFCTDHHEFFPFGLSARRLGQRTAQQILESGVDFTILFFYPSSDPYDPGEDLKERRKRLCLYMAIISCAGTFGLPEEVANELPIDERNDTRCWTFPLFNADGEVRYWNHGNPIYDDTYVDYDQGTQLTFNGSTIVCQAAVEILLPSSAPSRLLELNLMTRINKGYRVAMMERTKIPLEIIRIILQYCSMLS